ncbi:polymeric immunoglobulin receptor-like isoform X2 [Pimephales promelas]|uniref:polymeric immunoglobulin receptor-like isoform X2 n=1 Tax=Pimephales promelas TaxID=90988 RepID=UPI001955DCC5|nr:polymeric immunoglobulin receptor-like isoform X2 [Pimephales promelas]
MHTHTHTHTHTHSAIDMIYLLVLSGVLLYSSGVAGVNALELNIAVKSGSSVILPCVYDKQYKENRKYLCKGQFWSACLILAYAGNKGKYSITDYPDQSIFTVRWDNLQTSDSGYYWCAVETGRSGISYYLYLTVLTAPDVSVMSSSVSGHEGDDVSVRCFYSSEYKNKLKQWCRYKDKGCYTVGRTDTSQSSSVQISDDGRSSFTVLMTGLRLSDSGWFLCSVGDLQVPVQLTVKPKPVKRIPTAAPSDPETDKDTTQTSANRNPATVNEIINRVECYSGGSNHIVTIKPGGSVTIPCHYDEKNPPQKKYWYSHRDRSNIYTNTTEENLSVIDHPDQSLFTVTMRNLQNKHNGDYSCVVENDGKRTVTYELHLMVQSAPDVSVKSSSVSGHEGDDVSVRCLYTSGYKNKLKQWCRYKDQRCYKVGRTDTSQNSSVQISDDGRSSFTVLMTGLRLSDSGWFLCSVGDLQVPVQLAVKPKPVTRILTTAPSDPETDKDTTQTSANRNPTSVNEIINIMITDLRPETRIHEAHPSVTSASATINTEIHRQYKQNKPDMILLMSLVSTLVLFLLVSLVVIVTWMLRKKLERGHIREEEPFNPTSNTTASENPMTSISPATATSSASVDDCSVIYSSVIHKKGSKKKAALSSVDPEGDVIYSSVKKPQKPVHSRMDS